MHSLKTTTCFGQIFALAKPHDSVGKRTRNRIPKEERKTLVESFIKKHQSLHNGSFPSLSLTHKEVGGSFYTIREIVREIIQENRVLGTSDLVLQGKGSDHLQDQTLSSSILMDPVPPLSLSPDGFHSASDQSHDFSSEAGETKYPENGEEINGSQASLEDRGSDILMHREVNGYHLSEEDLGLHVHESVGPTQFGASCGEENDTNHDAGLQDIVETVCDSFATKPQDIELEADNKDRGFEEIPFIESEDTKPVNSDERMNDPGSAMTEMLNPTKNTASTIDLPAETDVETFPINLPAETIVETFPLRSVFSTMESSDIQPSEFAKSCEGEEGTEATVETDSSTITSVDLGSISAVPEEQGTEVIVGQMPNHISVSMENKVEEKIVNPASIDVECADTKGTVVANAVIGNGNVHETKEFSNGSLTTEQTMPTSGTESGSCKNDIARSEVTSAEKATVEKGKLNASDSSSSQKGNIATLNRIKPESWKGQSNVAGQETNPLLGILKSFLTAFMKFWSE